MLIYGLLHIWLISTTIARNLTGCDSALSVRSANRSVSGVATWIWSHQSVISRPFVVFEYPDLGGRDWVEARQFYFLLLFLGPPKKRGHTKKECRLAISHFVQHIIKSAKTRDRTDQWDKTMYNEKKSAQVGVIFCAIKMWVKRLNIYRLFLSNIIKKLVFLNH